MFKFLYDSDDSVFIGSPAGSGKTVCAELTLLRHWSQPEFGKAVYIAPFQELLNIQLANWQARFSTLGGGKTIATLTGETTADLRTLDRTDLILATPTQWDVLSRQWNRRKNVQNVELFIADELHMLGGQEGYIYEIVVSRMHYIKMQLEKNMRIIGLSVPLSNAKDVGEWLGATKHTIFNFSPYGPPSRSRASHSVLHYTSLSVINDGYGTSDISINTTAVS